MEGDLKYAKFSTNRDDAKECSTGEDFEFLERLTKEQVMAMAPVELMGQAITPEAWIQPYDYPKLFQPKTSAVLSRIIGRVAPVGSDQPPSMGASSTKEEVVTDKAAPSVQDLINK